MHTTEQLKPAALAAERQQTDEARDATLIHKAVDACNGLLPNDQDIANQMLTVGLSPADIVRLWDQVVAQLADLFDATRRGEKPFSTNEGCAS